MSTFIHPQALCESTHVGDGTRVWAFAHVLPGAVIGADSNICDGVFVENDVTIGDRVTVKCGVQVWDGVTLEDDVFVGPNVTFTNDPFPRSRQYPAEFPRTRVRVGASIGGNATILPGLTIGRHAMIGAGSVVTRDVPDYAIVVGNPARIRGYANTNAAADSVAAARGAAEVAAPAPVTGSRLVDLPVATDLRGSLVAAETSAHVPFEIKRFFAVYAVPSVEARGSHAHKACEQFLVCVRGSVRALVDDGHRRQEFILDSPAQGLYMPAMTWGTQYRYSEDAVLVVLASHEYDPDDYLRDYDDFLAELRRREDAA